jgi:hypothetical protein
MVSDRSSACAEARAHAIVLYYVSDSEEIASASAASRTVRLSASAGVLLSES